MKSLSKHQKGVTLALLSGIFYGFLGYFGITIIESNFSVANMLCWRFTITSLTMFVLIIPDLQSFKGKSKEIMNSFLLGAIFYGISAILYFISSKQVGTGIAMVMYFVYPVFVILINLILYKNKISNSSLFAVFLLITSMFMLVDITKSSLNVLGFTMGILSALFYAFYIVASKKNKLSANIATFTVSLGGACTCLIVALLDGSFKVPASLDLWVNILAVSIICTTLPILFLLYALQNISSEKASLLSVTEPLFVIIIGMIFLDEKITYIQAFGTVLALIGASIALIPNSSKSEVEVEP